MPFNSPGFLLLLLLTVPVYHAVARERWQHTVLFVGSFAFYWFAGVRDLVLLLVAVGANFAISSLGRATSRTRLFTATVLNLAILSYFKYRDFFVSIAEGHSAPSVEKLVIPLGISFYLFQLIAYQVDLYRGRVEYEKSFARLLLYVLFFPHHQAGPIMRPAVFLPQFRGVKPLEWSAIGQGVAWILYGLLQKVLADQIGAITDRLFLVAPETMADGWGRALSFAAQIYGDFAGYSNMAVGLGLLFGYRLDRNFNQPYVAVSPSEFWERWHITLSQWLRDYLYISLGGNRGSALRTYTNLMITMLLGGLWHGASWNFVIWGALHGLLLCIFRAVPVERRSRLLGWTICQVGVLFCWVPFRAATYSDTLVIWRSMVGLGGPLGAAKEWLVLASATALFLLVHLGEDAALGNPQRRARLREWWSSLPCLVRGAVSAVVFLLCAVILKEGTTFIYFRF